jgi:hypothetical protein
VAQGKEIVMPLLILLIAALALGYWLARSKYHEPIDKAAQQPKKWWNQLFHGSKTSETTAKDTNSEGKQEK